MLKQSVTIALDWTPNTNHTPIFVAQYLGFYQQLGIELQIINPAHDNYKVTPAKKIELGEAHLAICPTETIISYRVKSNPLILKAVAAIFQHDLSAIVTPSHLNITGPAGLAGKKYASYKARYEDAIVNKMVLMNGGEEPMQVIYPEKLGIWNTLLNGEADATWVFDNWEGVEAREKGVKLNYFKLDDYEIPYSYSPVIVGQEKWLNEHASLVKSFLAATQKGVHFAMENIDETIAILNQVVPEEYRNAEFLLKSQEYANLNYTTNGRWGFMKPEVIDNFLNWLHQQNLEQNVFTFSDLASNEFLPLTAKY
ncbi:MAG: ABC transporter substrate-binding protein [Bacteroidia bacterium]|jgi:ABC-type nitrate/sulfonate/bicarbonate transport system substrate-binding protein|nr:ABC transporter substrate-binding protein [Bacteroidia bacterium]